MEKRCMQVSQPYVCVFILHVVTSRRVTTKNNPRSFIFLWAIKAMYQASVCTGIPVLLFVCVCVSIGNWTTAVCVLQIGPLSVQCPMCEWWFGRPRIQSVWQREIHRSQRTYITIALRICSLFLPVTMEGCMAPYTAAERQDTTDVCVHARVSKKELHRGQVY